jgi:hypothetical protein
VEVQDEGGEALLGERVEDAPGGDGLALPGDAEHEQVRAARGADPPADLGGVPVLAQDHLDDLRQLSVGAFGG